MYKRQGKCDVMINLENGYEYVYAYDTSTNNSGEDFKYITVSADNGEEAVLIKKINPKIAGVAIVCQGGKSSSIKSAVIELVSTTLNIDRASISVEKRK